MPIMLLAIAIAVLPVLLMSISEARRNVELPGDVMPATSAAQTVDTIANRRGRRARREGGLRRPAFPGAGPGKRWAW